MNNTGAAAASRGAAATKTGANQRGFFGRVWDGLLAFGEARAKSELARHVRLHGGRPTGDPAQDARRLAALRGVV